MWIFSVPNFGSTIFFNIVQLATFNLYTYGYQLDTFLVSIAIALGYVSIAASQFLIGWLSDRFYTRWGRRKPWVIILAPITLISFIALLLPPLFLNNPSSGTLLGWLLTWNILFELSIGFTTPYGAWMAELFSVGERPKTSQIQNTFKIIGTGTYTIFAFLILTSFTAALKANPGQLPPASVWSTYMLSCIIFGAIFIACFYISTFFMPTEAPPTTLPDLKKNLRDLAKNRNYLLAVLVQGIASVAWTIIGTIMLNYTEIVLAFGFIQYALAGVTLLVCVILFLFAWRKLIAKSGKKNGLLLLFSVAPLVLACSLFGLVPFTSATALLYGLLFIVGVAFSLGGWYLITGIWFADLAEDDMKRTGEMKAGLYVGFPSIALNFFQALGVFILGAVVDIPYMVSTNLVPPFSIGYILWGPICAAFLIVAYFLTKKFIQWDFAWEKNPI